MNFGTRCYKSLDKN